MSVPSPLTIHSSLVRALEMYPHLSARSVASPPSTVARPVASSVVARPVASSVVAPSAVYPSSEGEASSEEASSETLPMMPPPKRPYKRASPYKAEKKAPLEEWRETTDETLSRIERSIREIATTRATELRKEKERADNLEFLYRESCRRSKEMGESFLQMRSLIAEYREQMEAMKAKHAEEIADMEELLREVRPKYRKIVFKNADLDEE